MAIFFCVRLIPLSAVSAKFQSSCKFPATLAACKRGNSITSEKECSLSTIEREARSPYTMSSKRRVLSRPIPKPPSGEKFRSLDFAFSETITSVSALALTLNRTGVSTPSSNRPYLTEFSMMGSKNHCGTTQWSASAATSNSYFRCSPYLTF